MTSRQRAEFLGTAASIIFGVAAPFAFLAGLVLATAALITSPAFALCYAAHRMRSVADREWNAL